MSRKIIISFVTVVCAAAGLWWIFQDEIAHYRLPSKFILVVAEFEYQGEQHTIRRVIECRPEKSTNASEAENPRNYTALQGSFGTHMADGSAVIFVTPAGCGRVLAADTENVPAVAWVANPEQPENIEAYFSRSYYDRQDAKVRSVSLRVEEADQGVTSAETGEFNWFFLQQNNDYENIISTDFAVCVGEGQWGQEQVLRNAIQGLAQPSLIDVSVYSQVDENLLGAWFGDPMLGFLQFSMAGFGISRFDMSAPAAGLVDVRAPDTIPFRKDGDTYTLADGQGFVMFNPEPNRWTISRTIPSFTAVVDGVPLTITDYTRSWLSADKGLLFYRPSTNSICHIWSFGIRTPKLPEG